MDILGILIPKERNDLTTIHFNRKLAKIDKILLPWKGKYLSICGKIGVQKLLNIIALDLSLKASVIEKLYLNPNWFSSKLVRMSHPMFKNGFMPFIQITTAHFQLFENKIISKISLFFKTTHFSLIHLKKTEQIIPQMWWLNSNILRKYVFLFR